MTAFFSASFTWKLVLKLISVSIRSQTIQEAGRLLPSHHPSQTLRTYQLSGVGEIVGVDGENDLSEDQEAELSADVEMVLGKEEIVVGNEEVAGFYGPALPTRADLAAAAREERDTQLRVYIIFSHRWKCNVIVCLK